VKVQPLSVVSKTSVVSLGVFVKIEVAADKEAPETACFRIVPSPPVDTAKVSLFDVASRSPALAQLTQLLLQNRR